jgi:hypothetical protein
MRASRKKRRKIWREELSTMAKAIKGRRARPDHEMTKMSPVNLRLLAGHGPQQRGAAAPVRPVLVKADAACRALHRCRLENLLSGEGLNVERPLSWLCQAAMPSSPAAVRHFEPVPTLEVRTRS